MAKLGKPAAAVMVMGAIIAVLLMLCTPRSTSRSSALDRTTLDPAKPAADTTAVKR